MDVRQATPALLATTDHPAWRRFAVGMTGTETVLLVHAPAGLGRGWFARSWSGESHARIVHVRAEPGTSAISDVSTAASVTEALGTGNRHTPRSDSGPGARALVLDSLPRDWSTLADYDWCIAHPPDLLLTLEEIVALGEAGAAAPSQRGDDAEQQQAARGLHRLTGGWLEPTLLLLREPTALVRAQQMMLPFISRWITELDAGQEMARVSFLEPITAATLAAFFSTLHGSPPAIADLLDAGLMVKDEDDTLFMPDLVRSTLQTLVRQEDPGLADEIVAQAIEAVAETTDLASAVEHAGARRHWGAMGDLLLERWTELFTSDARVVRRVLDALPTSIITSWLGDFSGAAVRLLKGAGTDGMSFVLPDGRLEYERDSLAQRMHARTTRLYRNPGPRALSFGLLEVGYLRLAGHDTQAATASRRLLTAMHRAESRGRVRPVLASVVNLHAGVSLAIGGDFIAADTSYRAAFHQVEGSNHHFLLSDTTSKLAVLAALRGDTGAARTWIAEHDRWIGRVGWGREMVGRSAHLARALVALADLDLEGTEAALRMLPPEPDQDEMWQTHVFVLAMRSVLAGHPRRALVLISGMRQRRPHPSRTPLAQHLFAIGDEAAALASPLAGPVTDLPAAPVTMPEVQLLEVYGVLVSGDLERAARLLGRARIDRLGDRWSNFAMQLHILLGRQDKDTMIESLIADVVSGRGALADLALLRKHGVLSAADRQRLSTAQRARLSAIPPMSAPTASWQPLTAREVEVLGGLRQGLTRREIAAQQLRSENTVRSQVRSLYRKLGATTLDEALEAARRRGL